ncbi:ABC transporter ATPase [Lentzea sp. NBRC 105346]|uniref:ABC-F family ATP-binding cassette domain-containing protein n=1 Tax=Lentzea sp. NBRC 105346 TaxID=3032205 RepID=UPI0025576E4A|nr:ABC-F family ATP-binding cassette domain-containing protein [Lentzea sp. NBRC 105346]GLZ33908.1 ABC transporter ATPase [Lentzea sp. NBRC 105346]
MRTHVHLTTEDLTKGYDTAPVLSGVTLTVGAGQRLGVIGENGRGKTTLLRLLAGDLPPDHGTVTRHGSVCLVTQEMAATGTVGDLLDEALKPAREALSELDEAATTITEDEQRFTEALAHAEAIEAWDAERRADMALKSLDAQHDRARRLDELSVGQRYRVRLACLLAERADVLLLDEPTNHLDENALRYLADRLAEHPGVVVLVSHDRALLDDVCTAVLDLDPTADGEPRLHGGGYTAFKAAKKAERARWEQRFQQENDEHDRLEEQVEKAKSRLVDGWRPPKGAFKHKRSTRAPSKVRNVARRLAELGERRVPPPPPPLRFAPPDLRAEGDLLSATPFVVPGRVDWAEPLALSAGDRLLVVGPNGSGKSTALNVLAGLVAPAEGAVHHHGRIGLLAQESSFDDETTRAGDVCPLAAELGLLSGKDLEKPVAVLSTGQRRRLSLACLLIARPDVLLLDEPTNHLSITLVDELTEALHATAAAVVVATHDRWFRTECAGWRTLRTKLPSQCRETSVASKAGR